MESVRSLLLIQDLSRAALHDELIKKKISIKQLRVHSLPLKMWRDPFMMSQRAVFQNRLRLSHYKKAERLQGSK